MIRSRSSGESWSGLVHAADTLEGALLQHAQELHLHVECHIADLVEKQRAAVGELETPHTGGERSGESALLVPEQLTFEELSRDGSAIDGDERTIGAAGQLVNTPRHELFAATRLAMDEHGAVIASDLPHQQIEPIDGGGCADGKCPGDRRSINH
jgi:hypothetical protein